VIMAELATIARPYAEALFKAVPAAQAQSTVAELGALAAVAVLGALVTSRRRKA